MIEMPIAVILVGVGFDDLRKRHRAAAPDHHRHVLQDDRDADRGDKRR